MEADRSKLAEIFHADGAALPVALSFAACFVDVVCVAGLRGN